MSFQTDPLTRQKLAQLHPIYLLDGDDAAYTYECTCAVNGGNTVLDLDASTSTETNTVQVTDNLTSYVCPSWATHVLVKLAVKTDTANSANYVYVKKNGQVNNYNSLVVICPSVANYYNAGEAWVRMSSAKAIIIDVSRGAGTITISLHIRGWGRLNTV